MVDMVVRKDLMGWGPSNQTIQEVLDTEKRLFDRMAEFAPRRFSARPTQALNEQVLADYLDFCDKLGYSKESRTVTLIEAFVFKRKTRMHFKNQPIGSCVTSNSFRGWMRRYLFELALKGDLNRFIGTEEFGPTSCAPFAPFNYGDGRKRGNMKSGDGSYCKVQGESYVHSGVVLCSNPRLLEILKSEGIDTNQEIPELQNERLYRAIGAWKYIDELRKEAVCPLLECPDVKTIDEILSNLDQFKPMFQCSDIAITKKGKDKDGFDIFTENTRDSWAHNMGLHGKRVSSSGQVYIEVSNESWGPDIIYPVPVEEVERWYQRNRCSTMAIGEIDGVQFIPKV